ncbi:hypothetical protein BDZ91DRAFT_724465 [Kalaharituber pfeilii]|nr:hypothetical protein BDZ91DRAFT_724465 [Kalaharituber pfeilii]
MDTPTTSPQQATSSQSPPNMTVSLGGTPQAQGAALAQVKEATTETTSLVEVFRCMYPKCEFSVRGFPQKEMLAKHLEDHRNRERAMERQINDPLGYCLTSMKSALGLDKEKKVKEEAPATEEPAKESEHAQARTSTTPLLAGATPAKLGLTPGNSASPAGGVRTPAMSNKPLPPFSGGKDSMKKEDTPMGGMDVAMRNSEGNDQLPTPPNSTVWEGALSPNTIRQCFAGLEPFSGLTAPRGGCDMVTVDLGVTNLEGKLTPLYTPGASPHGDNMISSGPGSDGDSVGAGLLEEWYPFGERTNFTSGLYEVNWEKEDQRLMGLEGEIGSMWRMDHYELRC